jgi:hypothetical protein
MRASLPWIALALLLSTTSAVARDWTDARGRVLQTGDLIDFDDDLVVLKNADGRLVTLAASKLSKADRDYLASVADEEAVAPSSRDEPTWTLADGARITGRVANYGRGELRIQRQNGRTYVNGRPWEQINEAQQAVIVRTVAAIEKRPIRDIRGMEALLTANRGNLSYPIEGVILELADGDEVSVPFILLAKKDVAALKPGWEKWVAANQAEQRQEEQSAILRTLATEYQRDREFQRRIQTLQFAKDWFDLWEVGLITPNGGELSVVVPARSSAQATYAALEQFPACGIGPIRRISRMTEGVGSFFGGTTVLTGP